MQFAITFIEGLVSFISPCVLPMLPVYISYFGGGEADRREVVVRAASFVAGFTAVFCLLGVLAGTLGMMLVRHRAALSAVCGATMIFFGLSCLGVIKIGPLGGIKGSHEVVGAASAFVFGVIYSLGLTPCTGPMLGAALMMAGREGSALRGCLLLASYSLGLGVPFVASAIALDRLKGSFAAIKRRYSVIHAVCGACLVVLGAITALGYMDAFSAMFE